MIYCYYISFGSNLGDRQNYINTALNALQKHPKINLDTISPIYETAPWGNLNQEPFLNGICELSSSLEPEELLQVLQQLEKEAGRTREVKWGPRTLDLDIVWCELNHDGSSVKVDSDTLTMPHPYFWDRSFVLRPLADLYPNFKFKGESIVHRLMYLESTDQ